MSVSSRFPPEVTAWMERWRLLRDGELLTTHSSWILPVRQGDMPAMLKVARIPDEEAGYRLLTWWDGQGAARVFASAAGYRKFNRPFWRVWRVGSGRASAALGTDRAQIGGSCVGFRHRGATQRLSA